MSLSRTIFAVSSGAPPAGIAVIRVSGPDAGGAMQALAGRALAVRHASLVRLVDPRTGDELDRALALWFPGPNSATGEDVFEIHAHGGRAVVRAIERALAALPGLRAAQPGEFTRRALEHGRIDLAEAEGLADLLLAETEYQRKQAMAMASGALSQAVAGWNARLLTASALIEARLDFADEDDVIANAAALNAAHSSMAALAEDWAIWLARPRAERVRDGLSVVIAGPPNSGKSTLINALSQREVAITSPIAGTTRDVIEVPLALDGIAFRFMDTAGLHAGSGDAIEDEGMARARQWVEGADILLWLGPPDDAPARARVIRIASKADLAGASASAAGADLEISALTGQGIDDLHHRIVTMARDCLPPEGEVAINARQVAALAEAHAALSPAHHHAAAADDDYGDEDMLILAERLRLARAALDRITGASGTESMLDALFGRFCIGK